MATSTQLRNAKQAVTQARIAKTAKDVEVTRPIVKQEAPEVELIPINNNLYAKHPTMENVYVSQDGSVLLPRETAIWLTKPPRRNSHTTEMATLNISGVATGTNRARTTQVWRVLAETFLPELKEGQVYVVSGTGSKLEDISIVNEDEADYNDTSVMVFAPSNQGRHVRNVITETEIEQFKDYAGTLSPHQKKNLELLTSKFAEQGIPEFYRTHRHRGLSAEQAWNLHRTVFELLFTQGLSTSQVAEKTGLKTSYVQQVHNGHRLQKEYIAWSQYIGVMDADEDEEVTETIAEDKVDEVVAPKAKPAPKSATKTATKRVAKTTKVAAK